MSEKEKNKEIRNLQIESNGIGYNTKIILDGKPLQHVQRLEFVIDNPTALAEVRLTISPATLELKEGRYKLVREGDLGE